MGCSILLAAIRQPPQDFTRRYARAWTRSFGQADLVHPHFRYWWRMRLSRVMWRHQPGNVGLRVAARGVSANHAPTRTSLLPRQSISVADASWLDPDNTSAAGRRRGRRARGAVRQARQSGLAGQLRLRLRHLRDSHFPKVDSPGATSPRARGWIRTTCSRALPSEEKGIE